ncbi:MAG TPA: GNAT family N-acetyltransferase [Sphingobacteriaceae bacterium]
MANVLNTELSDLEFIYELFEHSIRYQEERGFPVWKNYDREAIVKDIRERNQYKILLNGETGIIFSVAYSDKVIWRERDQGDSIYLHRIVVNPDFKGQKLFGKILDWSIEHAREKGLTSIRMDTWSSNPAIVTYYLSFGFRFIENYVTPDTDALPVHNRNLGLSLLEYPL